MKTIGTIVENGRITGILSGPDTYCEVIMVNGKAWRFDFSERLGPKWLLADGSTDRKCQCPSAAVWAKFEEWLNCWQKQKTKQMKRKAKTT